MSSIRASQTVGLRPGTGMSGFDVGFVCEGGGGVGEDEMRVGGWEYDG